MSEKSRDSEKDEEGNMNQSSLRNIYEVQTDSNNTAPFDLFSLPGSNSKQSQQSDYQISETGDSTQNIEPPLQALSAEASTKNQQTQCCSHSLLASAIGHKEDPFCFDSSRTSPSDDIDSLDSHLDRFLKIEDKNPKFEKDAKKECNLQRDNPKSLTDCSESDDPDTLSAIKTFLSERLSFLERILDYSKTIKSYMSKANINPRDRIASRRKDSEQQRNPPEKWDKLMRFWIYVYKNIVSLVADTKNIINSLREERPISIKELDDYICTIDHVFCHLKNLDKYSSNALQDDPAEAVTFDNCKLLCHVNGLRVLFVSLFRTLSQELDIGNSFIKDLSLKASQKPRRKKTD